MTLNVANGHLWVTLGAQSKLSYLKGLQDGISLLTLKIVNSKRSSEKTGMETILESYYLLPSNNNYKGFISAIDSVYSNTLNRKIPIIDVYLILNESENQEGLKS